MTVKQILLKNLISGLFLLVVFLCGILMVSCDAEDASNDNYQTDSNYDFPSRDSYNEDEEDIPEQVWAPEDDGTSGCSYGYGYGCEEEEPIDCTKKPCVYGSCVSENEVDKCVCAEGYSGRLCDKCAYGYVSDGLDCVLTLCKDVECLFGKCEVDNNAPVCICELGYTGELCDDCAEGYHIEDLHCVPENT